LERGILRLAEAGIPTYAVAGNHDWDVLPRILRQLDTPLFHLLGQGGRWETKYLERDGQRLLRIVGWSFPARYVRQSPLTDLQLAPDPRVPTVGLLHAHVNDPWSDYAPVHLPELQGRDVAVWVLGDIHKPEHWESNGGSKVLYPGSPQALAPNEKGPHGPWLIEVERPNTARCQQWAMSLIRYDDLDVDLSGAAHPEEFESRVHAAILAALEKAVGDGEPPQCLSLRLRFTGSTPLCGRLNALAQPVEELDRSRQGVCARIRPCVNLTRPAVEWHELSKRNDPAGALARALTALEGDQDDESVKELLQEATARANEVYAASSYAALSGRDPNPDREGVRLLLLQTGRQLLEELRAQHPALSEPLP
jgi:DNA repair exonuclease SbcCD nuclease subunit